MNDSYLITMNNLAITSVSEISDNVNLLSNFICQIISGSNASNDSSGQCHMPAQAI